MSLKTKSIDVVYTKLDGLLLNAKYDEARLFIRDIIQNSTSLSILLSTLIITASYQNVIGEERIKLIEKTRQLAHKIGGDEKVKEIARYLQ